MTHPNPTVLEAVVREATWLCAIRFDGASTPEDFENQLDNLRAVVIAYLLTSEEAGTQRTTKSSDYFWMFPCPGAPT